jgi:hypothetical protein
MSNKNRVNPDHYKVAGRDPQGEDFTPDLYRERFGRETARLRDGRAAIANFIPGAAPVGEAPLNGAVKGRKGASFPQSAPVARASGKEGENGPAARRGSGRSAGTASRRDGAKKVSAKKVSAKTTGARKAVGKKAPAKKAGSARRSTRSR